MCELLAMAGRSSIALSPTLERFSQCCGADGSSAGWGLAYYSGNDVRLLRDERPRAETLSHLAFAQVGTATETSGRASETELLVRRVGGPSGCTHVFAHYGELQALSDRWRGPFGLVEQHAGSSQSEHAFCALLNMLEPVWRHARDAGLSSPSVEHRRRVLEIFSAFLRSLGAANFLYSDGELLFAHAFRRGRDGQELDGPGLHVLARKNRSICPAAVDETDEVTLFATSPLTDEAWRPLPSGKLIVLQVHPPTPTLTRRNGLLPEAYEREMLRAS